MTDNIEQGAGTKKELKQCNRCLMIDQAHIGIKYPKPQAHPTWFNWMVGLAIALVMALVGFGVLAG